MTIKHQSPVVPTSWILVADRSRARFLSMEDVDAGLDEVETLINPEGGMHQSGCVSDQPGRFAGSAGYSVSGDPETDFAHKTAEEFAIHLIDFLEAGRNNHRFGSLIVIAPPLFLGTLRNRMPGPLSKMIVLEVDKDYTKHSVSDIAALVSKHQGASA